ncbi:MAG: hypothetical protein GY842_02285, partial [bacterium]|nr:hypothetical protein [bacterium]
VDYTTFSASMGDIKDVWESSRFACAFWLGRAYALTSDEKYAEAFWSHIESWCAQNPPNRGPNWKCGQETALRSMAWCFAMYAMWGAHASTPERVTALVTVLAFQGERIVRNIGYAVSQKNNHAFSEAAGLIMLGLLFPELKGSARWTRVGREVLEREILRQIYPDGSYVQQSMNYHRVMLHDCIWALRLTELNHQPLAAAARARVADAGEYLYQMLDVESGRVPNYGYNDGACILPLAAADFVDYRPTVQAARYLAAGRRVLGAGPWDEMLLWLCGPEALTDSIAAVVPESRRFDVGGYYTLRSRNSWGMVRCHSYRDRPAHVDLLHLDLWCGGVNVLGDSGTYRYFVPEDSMIERYFKDVTGHNTVELGGRGPLDLYARWVWLPWPRAKCVAYGADLFEGEHYGYRRSPWRVVHRRRVELVDADTWVVTDSLLGAGRHEVKLRWHLADQGVRHDAEKHCVELDIPGGRVSIAVDGPAGMTTVLHRGMREDARTLGWESTYYGEYAARPTLEAACHCALPTQWVTRIRLNEDTSR